VATAAQNLQQLVAELQKDPSLYQAPVLNRKPDAIVTTLPEVSYARVVPNAHESKARGDWMVGLGVLALGVLALKAVR